MDLDESDKQKTNGNDSVDTVHVLQSSRIRCTIQSCDGINKFLLDYGLNILPYVTIISWVVFLFV